MRNIKISIQYDGTKYDGWQKQGNTKNTISQKFDDLLNKMTNENIEIIGSGRTDAGVHAYKQIANFYTNSNMSLFQMKKYINNYLPKDIVVINIEEADDRFHSRLNAKSKKYLYRICNQEEQKVFERNYVYHYPKNLNIEKMKKATKYLIGEHDFASFSTTKKTKKSTIRTIYSIDIFYENDEIRLLYHGNGFLYNMVRILTGTLIQIGEGTMNMDDLKEIMESKERGKAGFTAPGQGLFLVDVLYE